MNDYHFTLEGYGITDVVCGWDGNDCSEVDCRKCGRNLEGVEGQ